MESQVLHVWCYISCEAAGEIWNWSLLNVKGLKISNAIVGTAISRLNSLRTAYIRFLFSARPAGAKMVRANPFIFYSCRVTTTSLELRSQGTKQKTVRRHAYAVQSHIFVVSRNSCHLCKRSHICASFARRWNRHCKTMTPTFRK